MNIRRLFSGSDRREREEAQRRTLVSEYYTSGEMDSMTPEEVEIAAQCIRAGTCLCGRTPLFIEGAMCGSCRTQFSLAIQGGLGIADPSIELRVNIAERRWALPGKVRKKLTRRRSD